MTAGSARLNLGLGRSLSVARDSEVGPSLVVARWTLGMSLLGWTLGPVLTAGTLTLGSCLAWWDPRLFVALPGSEGRPRPGLTSGVFSLGRPSGFVCVTDFPSRA
jgi:hypothetical protein